MAVVTELVTKFGFEGSTAPLASYNKALGQAVKGLAGFAAATGAALVAGAGVLGVINKETAQMASLAEAVGLTTRQYQAYGAAAAQVGLDSEVVVDLFEEMNNKFGESAALMAKGEAPLGAVSDAMGILGLEFENISSLKPDEQFRAISKAIEDMPDAQQAASAADILFGGDANKFFSNMKKTGQSLDSLTKKYDAINFLTKDGIKGAKAYTQSFGNLGRMFSSIGREISGVVGGQLTPEIEDLTRGITDLISENKDWIIGIAGRTVDIVVATGKAIARLTPFILAGAAAWGVMTLATGGFATVMAVLTSPVTLTIAALAAAALIIDDLIVAFQGGNSVIADFAQNFLGIDIVPALHGIVDGVMWAVDQVVLGFKMWFDFFAAGWDKYSGIIETISGFFGGGKNAEINVNDNTSGGERAQDNISRNSSSIMGSTPVSENRKIEFDQIPQIGNIGFDQIPQMPSIQNEMTRAGGMTSATSNTGTTNNNKIENTTSITIQTTNAAEARAGVDNALQDQMRNTETALNRID